VTKLERFAQREFKRLFRVGAEGHVIARWFLLAAESLPDLVTNPLDVNSVCFEDRSKKRVVLFQEA
jgi:hypothetical protein